MARTLTPALLVVALLTGCAPGDDHADGGGSSASPAAPSAGQPAAPPSRTASPGPDGREMSSVPPPVTIRPSLPPKTPTDVPPEITVEGTVHVNLECVLLTDRLGGIWNLQGDATRKLRTDQWVAAKGRPSPEPGTSCAGSTLVVRTVTMLTRPPR